MNYVIMKAKIRRRLIKMENYKELGRFIGALMGCILTGVCVYFTGSVWSAIIPLVCLLFGGWIGKLIEKPEEK